MSGQPNRLNAPFGAWIDRNRRVVSTFTGKRFDGFAGDTVASALAANGKWILSRSFKYHRPRGILTMAGQDANTLVQLPNEANALADTLTIEENMHVTAQNVSGSLDCDRAALTGRFSKFLPVGFYYKTFFRRPSAWRLWEPIIRRRAGLGRVSEDTTHGYYDKAYGWHDVVVIGGGSAGMSAALQAAQAGADVLLVDENPHLGGALTYERFDATAAKSEALLRELVNAVAQTPSITVMTDAICNGWFADNWLPIVRGKRLHKVRAKQVVLATGAMEQPLVFRNNDLPGVMMASAAQRLIRRYGVRPGNRAVVVTSNEQGYGAALDLLDAGCEVASVLELRDAPINRALADALRDRSVPILYGWTAHEAVPTRGNRHVRGAIGARIAGRGSVSEARRSFDCDLVCMSVGFAPTYQLLAHAGGGIDYSPKTSTFAIWRLPHDAHVAGAVNGSFSLEAAMAEGRRAGWAAAKELGLNVGREPAAPNPRGEAAHSHPWPIFPHPKGKEFVDFDEDLTVADLRNAIAEGYDHIELLKRYSAVGMGPSQGRHSALNTIRIAADATGRPIEAVGRTTARPPFAAETFGVLAGRRFDPVRLTPMHHRHVEAGAQMMPAGTWLRPAYYGTPDTRECAINDEALAVRRNVGLIDVSTLGKLEIRGPDAAEFLERIYTFAYVKQPVGRSRYVLMTDETGAICDDGVACRFAEQHFYVTATTGNADAVYREMLRRNAMWRLDIDIMNVTAAYAAVNIAGPKARDVLTPLCSGVDLSKDAFPYLAVRSGKVAGIPARLIRVGFVGELGYEIHVPSGCGEALWDALIEAGDAHGMARFGVEAQRLLRLEKGHIIVGQDTDGLTIPQEAAMAWAIARKKRFFVGKRAIEVQERRGIECVLVGFELAKSGAPLPEECHLTLDKGEIAGRVTSVARSPVLGKTIGMAYVRPHQSEIGTVFDIKIAHGQIVNARIVALPFYDPDNARQELERMVGQPRNSIDPTSPARRSPIYRTLSAAGARSSKIGDAAVASSFGDARDAEDTALLDLALVDLATLPRTGFKGRTTVPWLSQQCVHVEGASNRAYPCGDNSLAVRLAPNEVLILGSRDGQDDLPIRLDKAWTPEAGIVFPVPRRDGAYWFSISGRHAPAMFAKLCSVDLRPGRFDNLAVAQTSVARINAIVVRDDIKDVLAYHLLGDVALAGSMWSYLVDAMAEFDGRIVGHSEFMSSTKATAG